MRCQLARFINNLLVRLATSGSSELRNLKTMKTKRTQKMISKLLRGKVKVLDKPNRRSRKIYEVIS